MQSQARFSGNKPRRFVSLIGLQSEIGEQYGVSKRMFGSLSGDYITSYPERCLTPVSALTITLHLLFTVATKYSVFWILDREAHGCGKIGMAKGKKLQSMHTDKLQPQSASPTVTFQKLRGDYNKVEVKKAFLQLLLGWSSCRSAILDFDLSWRTAPAAQ